LGAKPFCKQNLIANCVVTRAWFPDRFCQESVGAKPFCILRKKNKNVQAYYTLESKEGSRQAHQKVSLAYTCKGRIFPFCKQNLLANYVVTRVWLPARFGRRVWVRNRFVRRIWLAESCFCNPSLVARPLEAVRSTPHPFCRHCWGSHPIL
jgi:hypothetical protein